MKALQALPRPIESSIEVPGDKSLTHRGILMSALARGDMELTGWLDAADTRSSLNVVQSLGVQVAALEPGRLVLRSEGRLQEPAGVADCGNSGTTMRLASGLAAGAPGLVVLTGDQSLVRRPMARVVEPLRDMGLSILSRRGGLAPLAIQGGPHPGGAFTLAVASAQVKSALLLAGLTAEDAVTVSEPTPSRDHSERLIRAMGGDITIGPAGVTVRPSPLAGMGLGVPGDPSSAAFWATLAALSPNRRVTVPNMLFNPTRTGFFTVLEKMGAKVVWSERGDTPEPWGSVTVSCSRLRPTALGREEIPSLVDEVSLVALLATQAEGITVVRGAEELRVKESDRVRVTAKILRAMGGRIEEQPDGWIIEGPTPLHGAPVDAEGDHRMAMLAAVAATVAFGPTQLTGEDSVAISYPGFFAAYDSLGRIGH